MKSIKEPDCAWAAKTICVLLVLLGAAACGKGDDAAAPSASSGQKALSEVPGGELGTLMGNAHLMYDASFLPNWDELDPSAASRYWPVGSLLTAEDSTLFVNWSTTNMDWIPYAYAVYYRNLSNEEFVANLPNCFYAPLVYYSLPSWTNRYSEGFRIVTSSVGRRESLEMLKQCSYVYAVEPLYVQGSTSSILARRGASALLLVSTFSPQAEISVTDTNDIATLLWITDSLHMAIDSVYCSPDINHPGITRIRFAMHSDHSLVCIPSAVRILQSRIPNSATSSHIMTFYMYASDFPL